MQQMSNLYHGNAKRQGEDFKPSKGKKRGGDRNAKIMEGIAGAGANRKRMRSPLFCVSSRRQSRQEKRRKQSVKMRLRSAEKNAKNLKRKRKKPGKEYGYGCNQ